MTPTLSERVAVLESQRVEDVKAVDEIKGLVRSLDSKLNKVLIGACGVMFTAMVNLVIAYTRLGK